MTKDEAQPPVSGPDVEDTAEASVQSLLRNAFPDVDGPPPDVLPGVQQKLRQRSHGKFYADGWSTARQPPVATYLITSLVMLAVLLAVYAMLGPLRGSAEPVVDPPVPVRVVPPARP